MTLSMDLRVRVLEAYTRGEGSHAELAARFAVSQATVKRWVRRQRLTGNIHPLPIPGRPRACTPEIEEFLVKYVRENPEIARESLRVRVMESFDVELSAASISRALSRNGLAVKRRSLRRKG